MLILCHLSRLFVSLQLGIPSEIECWCPSRGMSFALLVVPLPPVSLMRVDFLVSEVPIALVVGIVYVWPIWPRFFRDLSSGPHRPLWWWCHQWSHPLMPQWLWSPLLRGLPLPDGLRTAASLPVGVRICVASSVHLCPRIHPGVDSCIGIMSLH